MTNEYTSVEKYISHTLFERVAKGLRKGCVWEVSWRLNRLQHIDPLFLWLLKHFFLILLGCSAGSWFSLLRTATRTLTNSNCLSVAPGYIIVWHPPASCGRRICTKFNPSTCQGYILISSTGCTCWSIDGWVEGQYVTETKSENISSMSRNSHKVSFITIIHWSCNVVWSWLGTATYRACLGHVYNLFEFRVFLLLDWFPYQT